MSKINCPKVVILLFVMLCLLVLISADNSMAAVPSYKLSISKTDSSIAKKALIQARKRNWTKAISLASRARNPIVKDVVLWRRYYSQANKSSFVAITNFIKKHPKWPDLNILERNAEQRLNADSPADKVIGWFGKKSPDNGDIIFRTPITANGKHILADIISLRKDSSKYQTLVTKLLRESWVGLNLTAKQEKIFLAKHKDKIRIKDHILRIDRLLWRKEVDAANRIINLVDKTHKNLFKARMRLMKHKFGVDAAILLVPKKLRKDEGILYERIRWRERHVKGKNIAELLEQIPTDTKYPHKWWSLRKKYIRKMVREKKYKIAYKLSKYHGFTNNISKLAEAEWQAGWIAFYYLKDHKTAYKHFYTLYNKVKTPISLGRASYWAGRAAEKNHNIDIANDWYLVASKYPTSFYGQLATEKLGEKSLFIPRRPVPTWVDNNYYQTNDLVTAVHLLTHSKDIGIARKFLRHMVKNAATPGEQLLIANIGKKLNRPDYTISIAREVLRNKGGREEGVFLLDYLYPAITTPKDPSGKIIRKPEKGLINSIILQESIFDSSARSHAGALGLMQLMPATAKETAKKHKFRYNKRKLTSNPEYNIALGSRYLEALINRWDGSYILAIASYNGGAGNVRKWIKANGDPREMKTLEEVINWIEHIPFAETQNYVQRVIENLQIYRYLLSDDPAIVSTGKDLTR